MAEAVAKTPVVFGDRTVEFNAKQKLVKETTISGDTITTHLFFRNGEMISFSPRADMILQFAGHGVEQKLGDAVAGYKDDELDDAVETVRELVVRLDAGDWSVRREAGTGAGSSILLRALVEASGKTTEDIRTFLSTKTQAEKLALRNTAALKPIIQRLEAEKAKTTKSTVDTDALLGDLGIASAPAKGGKSA